MSHIPDVVGQTVAVDVLLYDREYVVDGTLHTGITDGHRLNGGHFTRNDG
jgi:hypothetical protein